MSLGGYSMAMHAFTRQSKTRQSACGGKSLSSLVNLLRQCRMSPSLEYSMNKSPGSASRSFAMRCSSADFGFGGRPRGGRGGSGASLSANRKTCTVCGARRRSCS